ncbi:MAG: hypothetical protein R3E87_13135 [Burkholderiaceae bacterium]
MFAATIRRALYAISGRLACRIISDGEHPYLERYFLFRAFGLTAYLHRFVGSDPDRGLHDHPWPWAFSVVLSGRYLERRRGGDRVVSWLNLLSGDTFHRVIMLPGSRSVWTLFVHSNARAKPWGFWHESEQTGGLSSARWTAHRSHSAREWWRDAPPGRASESRQPADA